MTHSPREIDVWSESWSIWCRKWGKGPFRHRDWNLQMGSSDDWRSDDALLQYSCLENPMDGGAWWAAVHGVAKSQTRLSNFTFTFHFHALKKEMANHSSVLAWRIPGMGGGPGGLQSVGSHRVGHNSRNLAAAAAVMTCLLEWLKCKSKKWVWKSMPGPDNK